MPRYPIALVGQYEKELARQLPRIRDGHADAIHQGRVATRRLREGLRLLDDGARVREALAAARTIGRTLGHVRELDVLADVLHSFELRVPVAAAAAAGAAAALRAEQRDARRQMIKSLDRIDLSTLRTGHLDESRAGLMPRQTAWRHRLVSRIDALGAKLEEVLHHASGVFLPNRSHRLRLVVKKLRYAVEAASVMHVWREPAALGVLRRAQGRLGELHDLYTAQERMDPGGMDAPVREQVSILRDVIAADLERRHQRFLALRDDLAAAAVDCRRLPALYRREVWRARGAMLVAAAVPGVAALVSSALTTTARQDGADGGEASAFPLRVAR